MLHTLYPYLSDNDGKEWQIPAEFFSQTSTTIPPPLDKAFVCYGIYCPSLSFITKRALQDPTIPIYIIPKQYSLKNMNFTKYKDALNKNDPSYEFYEEVQVTDDPFSNCYPLKSVLLPRLSPNPNTVFKDSVKNVEVSIMDAIRSYATCQVQRYITVEGLAKTGKTMLCQVLIPMIFSHEENTKDFLYMYIDVKTLRSDSFSDFCCRLIQHIRDDLCKEALGNADIRFRNSRDPPDLKDVFNAIKALNEICKTVLVFDEAQYFNEHSALHSDEINNFFDSLSELTRGGRFKLIFAGREMLNFWYEITKASFSGTWLPQSALQLFLPSYHHPNLRKRIDKMLKEAGFAKSELTRKENQTIISTAAQMIKLSKDARESGTVDDAFGKLLEGVIVEYNFSLSPFIRLMHEDPELRPVLEELFSIVKGPRTYKRLENILAKDYTKLSGLYSLYRKVELEDGEWEVSLEPSIFKQYMATVAADFDNFIKHAVLPTRIDLKYESS